MPRRYAPCGLRPLWLAMRPAQGTACNHPNREGELTRARIKRSACLESFTACNILQQLKLNVSIRCHGAPRFKPLRGAQYF